VGHFPLFSLKAGLSLEDGQEDGFERMIGRSRPVPLLQLRPAIYTVHNGDCLLLYVKQQAGLGFISSNHSIFYIHYD
jgi:hypothetical protein